jgi:capsular exopolysaccharide synthesis family protein
MNQISPDPRAEAELFLDEPETQGAGSPGLNLHALLRGRYHWAIILGLVLAVCGALAGYFSQGDVYRSTILIAISPVGEGIFRDDYDVSRHYESWVQRQLAIMAGPKVLEPAISSDEWQSTAVGVYRTSADLFATGLKLGRKRGQEVIEISYEAPVPEWAQVGTQVITLAYMDELQRSEQQSDSHVLRVLENNRLDLLRRIEKLKADKRGLSTEHNEHTIKDVLDRLTEARDKLEAELGEVRIELSELGLDADETISPDQLTFDQLAMHHPKLQAMLDARDQVESDISYKKRLGMGERHREMKDLNAALDTLNAEIEKLARSLRGTSDGTWLPENQPDEALSPIAALRAKERRLTKQHEDAKAETQHLAMIYGQMQTITLDLQDLEDELAVTSNRIRNIQIEAQAAGRAEVLSTGELPTEPYNTGKRKQLAALGGMAGLCGGFGLVILLGLMDRRLRHIEDAQSGLAGRMLGVLPELPEDLTDPEQAVLASHCVHQVRTLLQINRGPDGFILAVTGPAAGSGKTSLTMALGMSFASSGSRTLLIDCDIVGGGLTRRMLDAKSPAKSTGVLEACNGTAFADCVVETKIPNLHVIPIGSALPSQAGNLSPAAVKKLLAKARDAYDTVLVDTGPVLGSLEASMVSAQADKTIVIVSRGDQKPVIAKSLTHLRSIGADIAGIVFNHADAVDIERSTYASVTVSQNRRQDDKDYNEVQWIDRDTSDRYGPLATAVASYGRTPTTDHDTD